MNRTAVCAALIAATIIVAVVCVALVFMRGGDARSENWPWRYDGPPIEDWPWRDDEFAPTLVVCPGGLFESYVSNKWGCDALEDLRVERNSLRVERDQLRAENETWVEIYLALPLTSCLEQQRAFDTHYKIGGAQDRLALRTANLMRRECGDTEAARYIEATTQELPDWAASEATATPEPDKCSGRGLSTKEYARCRCTESGSCR